MIKYNYTIDFINKLFLDISNTELNNDVNNYLNSILEDIKKPVYNISPNFNTPSNTYKSNKNRNFKNYKNYRSNRNNRSNGESSFDNFFSNRSRTSSYNNLTTDLSNTTISTNTNTNTNTNNTKNDSDMKLRTINRVKDINDKSDLDLTTINIRKILNKITNTNYSKLKNEFLCTYNSLYIDKNNNNLDEIDLFIFNSLVYNNKLFSELYSELLYNLININENFTELLNNNLETFIEIHKTIKSPSSLNYDEISLTNKHNDKYKTFCQFYINCFKKNLLPIDLVFRSSQNIQNEILVNMKLDDKKRYCEELTEYLSIIVPNIFKEISNDDTYIKLYKNLYENIELVANLNLNSYPSISNKIIFKHKDLLEKYNLKI